MPKNRTEPYRRRQRYKTIARKKRIIHSQHDYWNVRHDGALSKGKIHCSCPMCRHKSSDNARISDLRKVDQMVEELPDYGIVGDRCVQRIYRRTKSDQKRSLKGLGQRRSAYG